MGQFNHSEQRIKKAVTGLSDFIIRSLTLALNSNSLCLHLNIKEMCADIFFDAMYAWRHIFSKSSLNLISRINVPEGRSNK